MIIKEQLLVEHSKKNTQLITAYIGTDQKRLKELMECFFSNTYRVTQRAAMVVSDYFDKYPKDMEPYLEQLVLNLENPDIEVAVKRNTVRILQFIPIPEALQASLFDRCLAYLIDTKETIAVKAFSMGILAKLCQYYPELKMEVIPIIEELIAQAESKGILSRGRSVLQTLYQL